MPQRRLMVGIGLSLAAAVAWWWAGHDPLPEIAGTWRHVAGGAALGRSCTIGSGTLTTDDTVRAFRLERIEDGVAVVRLLPAGPVLPVQRSGEQLLVMGPQGGEYARQR
jgi:hypothetical protein